MGTIESIGMENKFSSSESLVESLSTMSEEFLIDSFCVEMGESVGLEEETSSTFAAVPPAICAAAHPYALACSAAAVASRCAAVFASLAAALAALQSAHPNAAAL